MRSPLGGQRQSLGLHGLVVMMILPRFDSILSLKPLESSGLYAMLDGDLLSSGQQHLELVSVAHLPTAPL